VEEEKKIKEGTSLALSVAGTYAVAHREGLEHLSQPSYRFWKNQVL
jgi:hypothetical protein